MRKIIFIKLYGNRNQAMLHIYISSENFINQLIKNTYMSRLRPSNHSSNIHTNFFLKRTSCIHGHQQVSQCCVFLVFAEIRAV